MSEEILLNLLRRVEGLEKDVFDLKTQAIIDATELPEELLHENGLLPTPPTKTRRGRGSRPLMKSEIEEAISKSKSMAAAARKLGVSSKTLKKYSREFCIWAPSRPGRKKQ